MPAVGANREESGSGGHLGHEESVLRAVLGHAVTRSGLLIGRYLLVTSAA
jgi:hypothetical protein